MESVTIHTRLKAGKEAEYDTIHQVIPAELDALLREHGVISWRIYRKDRDLFHTVECTNYKKLMAAVADHPINAAWQKKMAEFLEITHDYSNPNGNTLSLVWKLPETAEK
jgi:L-rhamnose mutarotase